jgi:hypothetical protein
LLDQPADDPLAQFLEKQDLHVAIDARQFGYSTGRNTYHKLPYQIVLNTWKNLLLRFVLFIYLKNSFF